MKYIIALFLPLAIMSCGGNEATTSVEEATNAVVDMGNAVAEQAEQAMTEAGDMVAGEAGMTSLNETVDAINNAGGLTKLSPEAAVGNIDSWIAKLDGMDGTGEVVKNLRDLKAELTSGNIDGKKVGTLLNTLAEDSAELAPNNVALVGLSKMLGAAGSQLGGM